MIRGLLCFLVAAWVSTGIAGELGAGSIDRLVLPPPASLIIVPNTTTSGRTLRAAQTLNPAVRNLVIIQAGQSNNANVAPSLYTPTNPTAIDNLNIYDGGIYAAADPLVGTSDNAAEGNPALRLADSLITAGLFDRVVIAPVSIGSTSVADWETNSLYSTRIPIAIWRLAAKGMIDGMPNIRVVVLWGQGENDTVGGTSQSAYTNSLNNVIAASRSAGFNGLWFVAKESWDAGSTSAAVQAAQAAVVNHGANVWAGPDADSLNGSTCSGNPCRDGGNTHWTDAGSASYAAAWKTAMHAFGPPF